jgi:hypothetical protein
MEKFCGIDPQARPTDNLGRFADCNINRAGEPLPWRYSQLC